MNLRDWLIVFGVVIIAGIILDGIRRMRRARKDSLEMSIGMGGEIENTPLDDGFNPELPNGGARMAGDLGVEGAEPELHAADASVKATSNKRIEPSLNAMDSQIEDFDDDNLASVRAVARVQQETSDDNSDMQTIALDQDEIRRPVTPRERVEKIVSSQDKKLTFGDGLKPGKSGMKKSHKQTKNRKNQKEATPKSAQEVIILNVMSKSQEGFKGADLKALLDACGLQHGSMSIFHRHEDTDDSPVQFSIANAVEPGYFPADQLNTLATPGICFFMSMPGPQDNMRAFDYMYETAQCVVRNLSGEMKDERRSDITPQTIEHCRQRIRDFERRQMTARC